MNSKVDIHDMNVMMLDDIEDSGMRSGESSTSVRSPATGATGFDPDRRRHIAPWSLKKRPWNFKKKSTADILREKIIPNQGQERVVLNVGGIRHETLRSTLRKIPGSRLAKLTPDDEAYDMNTGHYFFDRNPILFAGILNYYRTGELHVPQDVCGPAIKNELDFWGLAEGDIETCCWVPYIRFKEHKDTLATFDTMFDIPDSNKSALDMEMMSCWQQAMHRLWLLIEYPSTSIAAKLFMVFSVLFTGASLFVMVFETHDSFKVVDDDRYRFLVRTGAINVTKCTNPCNCTNSTLPIPLKPMEAMNYVDYCCTAFFTVEFMMRLVSSPNKKVFFTTVFNLIDIMILLTFYSASILEISDPSWYSDEKNYLAKVIIALRVFRIFRIFKITRHYSGMKVLVYTIQASTKELFLIIVFLFTGVLIFACFMYQVEDKSTFSSIPIAFWWSLITMTTIGYGDYVPVTREGHVIGSICAVGGVLVIAFTVPVAVNNFTLYYSHAQSRLKFPRKDHHEWLDRKT